MRRVRPFPFDRLSRLAHNQLEAGRSFRAHLPLGKGPGFVEAERVLGAVSLRLVECFVARARDLEALLAGVVVRLAGPGDRWALVVVERALAVALAGAALGVDPAREPELPAPRDPTLAEAGALELLVQLLVEAQPVQVVGVVDPEGLLGLLGTLADDALVHVMECRVEHAVGRGAARAIVPDALALAAARPRPREALARRAARLEPVRLAATLELARAPIDRATLAGLARGDVLAFDVPAPRDAVRGALRVGRGAFPLTIERERAVVDGPFRLHPGGPEMPSEPQARAADDAGADQLLRELPVDVVCELGRVTMNGRELLELEPGAVVPIARPLAGPIDLTVGGRLIARGELVDVEGDLGVRITEVVE